MEKGGTPTVTLMVNLLGGNWGETEKQGNGLVTQPKQKKKGGFFAEKKKREFQRYFFPRRKLSKKDGKNKKCAAGKGRTSFCSLESNTKKKRRLKK